MRCNFDVDFILRYNDNGLSEIERRNFEEHRKGCILCKNKLVVDGDFIDYLKGSMIEDTSIQTYVMSEIDLNMYRGGKKMKLIHLLSWKSNGMKAAVAVLILGMLCLPFFLSQSLRAVVQNSVSNVLNKQNRMDNKNFLGTPTPAVSNTVAPSPMVTAKTSQTPMPEATPVTFKYPASEIKYVAPDGYQLHHVVDVDDQTLWLAMESDANYRMLSFNKVSKQVTEMTAFDKFLSQFGKTLPKMKILKNNDVYFSLGKKALIMDGKSFTLKKEIQFSSDVSKEEKPGDGQLDISFARDKLAYTTSEGLYICNLDFSNAQKVVNRFKGKTEMDVTVPRTPIWSFDDTKIGYTELGYEWTNGLCIFDVASNKTQMYSTKDTEFCYGMKWSKDSKIFAGAEDFNS